MNDKIMINKLSVLLVENKDAFLNHYKAFLKRIGLKVDIAITGPEAIEKFKASHYSLVILDENLPDMCGSELSKQLRGYEIKESRIRTPFILLGSYKESLGKEQCIEAHIDTYIVKTTHSLILENVILQYLNMMPNNQLIDMKT